MSNELAPAADWPAALTRGQYGAILRLRWQMLRNGFRRKGGTGELVARILVLPMFFSLGLGLFAGALAAAFYFTSGGHLDRIAWLLWAVFGLCQLLNINLGTPGSTFDPTQLIRFPLSPRNYTLIRLCFGLFAPANVIGTALAVAVALGVLASNLSLWWAALLVLALFAAANVIFTRMVFSWVDRWLSTRRAREAFTGLIVAGSLGIQYLNFAFNPAYNHGHQTHVAPEQLALALSLYHRAQPLLALLPPGLSAAALVAAAAGRVGPFLLNAGGVAAYAAAFYAVFSLRMQAEYRGENLSEAANATPKKTRAAARTTATTLSPAAALSTATALSPAAALSPGTALSPAAAMGFVDGAAAERTYGLSPVLFALLGKEFLYLRRNIGLFYGLAMPLLLVFLFAGRMATRSSASWIFPAALAYTLLGIIPISFNSLGLDAAGAQFYFIAPVRLRDVFLAKNLLQALLAGLEIVAVYAMISYVARPPAPSIALATVFWLAATLCVALSVGNRRSISAPKRISSVRAMNKQASPLSGFIAMGILLASAAVAAVVGGLALYLHVGWLLAPLFAVLAAGAFVLYGRSLEGLDAYAYARREELLTELGKPE